MAEYIDREAAIEAIMGEQPDAHYSHWYADKIKSIPAADVAHIVRCKDCIRRYDTDECPMCFLSEGKYYEYTNGNGYCDRGERKQVETDY